MGAPSTQSESVYEGGSAQKPVPGALLVFSGNAPMLRAVPVAPGPVTFGREDGVVLPDEKASRRHAQLSFDGPGWTVIDLDSRNGTFIDGHRVQGEARASPNAVVRLAQSIVILVEDVRPFLGATVTTDKFVIGPTLRGCLDRITVAARGGANVLIGGENGSGKELAARTFHEAAVGSGPFVAVNCATIPEPVAERVLFGAVKGVYTDLKETVDGHVQAADGGTLFLDEVAELPQGVQAKLLRLVETGEVARLGENTPKKVKVRFVAASHADLRRGIGSGAFRQDLFYRLAQIEERLPPLRERREELPWLVANALAEEKVRVANATLIETALMRPWPGNVRELVAQVKKAAMAAHTDDSKSVRETHLDPQAGMGAVSESVAKAAPAASDVKSKTPGREELADALAKAAWNVAETARALGLHRTQLNRLIERYGLERPGSPES